jgi:hypothetical protein
MDVASELLSSWSPRVAVATGTLPDEDFPRWVRSHHLPVVVISETDDDGSLGSGVVRVQSEPSPEAVLSALRDLGVIPAS